MAYFFLLILFICLWGAKEYIDLPAIRNFKVEINQFILLPFFYFLKILKLLGYCVCLLTWLTPIFFIYEEINRYLVFPFWNGFFNIILLFLTFIIWTIINFYLFSIILRIFEKLERRFNKIPDFTIFIRPFSPRKVGVLTFLVILLLFWEYFPSGETTCARFKSGKYTEEQAESYLRSYGERVGVRIHNIYGMKYECSLEPWREKRR